MAKEAAKALEEWTPISERIITARFWSRHIIVIMTTLIQVYAPTNDADEETKHSFYEQLQSVIHLTPHHDITI
jgi:exonuclease III